MKNLYNDMLTQTHILIAGKTGSGKSVVINGMINAALNENLCKLILIDPKRVALAKFRNAAQTIRYASEPEDMVKALEYAMELCDMRYRMMQAIEAEDYEGSDIYVIIDELADLMTTNRKEVAPLIQRLCQIGRASRIHLIAATQCPLSCIIPTPIKVNFDTRVALKTVTAQHSRNIMDCTGCETLPPYGKAFYITPNGSELIDVPMVSKDELRATIDRWTVKPSKPAQRRPEPARPAPRKGFFARLFA